MFRSIASSPPKRDLARDMIRRAHDSPLRFIWVTADAAYGQHGRFRRFIEDLQLHYVVAVPKSQQVHGPRTEDRFRREAPPEACQRLSAGRPTCVARSPSPPSTPRPCTPPTPSLRGRATSELASSSWPTTGP